MIYTPYYIFIALNNYLDIRKKNIFLWSIKNNKLEPSKGIKAKLIFFNVIN